MNLQQKIFKKIASSAPDKNALIHELTETLSLSTDSVYRRMRGETELTLSEIEKLCIHYSLSLDGLLKKNSEQFLFQISGTQAERFSYTEYLKSLNKDLKSLGKLEDYELIFSAKDFPFFYHFLVPEIAEFKGFFWEKTVFQSIKDKKKVFHTGSLNEENLALGREISEMYAQIPCHELWNEAIFHSILSQISFYHESQFVASKEDTEILLDKLIQLIDHFQIQAEQGCKVLRSDSEYEKRAPINLYVSDTIIGHNYVLLNYQSHKRLYIAHNIINSIYTDNQTLCQSSWDMHQRLFASANLISRTSEKIRIQFFNGLRKNVEETKERLLL